MAESGTAERFGRNLASSFTEDGKLSTRSSMIFCLLLFVTFVSLLIVGIIRLSSRDIFTTRFGDWYASVNFKAFTSAEHQTAGVYRLSISKDGAVFARTTNVHTFQLTPSDIAELRDESITILFDDQCSHFVFVIDLATSDSFVYSIEEGIVYGDPSFEFQHKYTRLRVKNVLLPELFKNTP